MPVALPLLYDLSGSRIDRIAFSGRHRLVENVTFPSFRRDLHIGYGTGSGQHPPLYLLSFHRRPRGGRPGHYLALINQSHLSVGTIVHDQAGLFLVEDVRHHQHGHGVRAYLMPHRRRDYHLGIRHPFETRLFSAYHGTVPLRRDHSKVVQHVLSRVGQIPYLYALEQRKLERVAADSYGFDLAQVYVQGLEQ